MNKGCLNPCYSEICSVSCVMIGDEVFNFES